MDIRVYLIYAVRFSPLKLTSGIKLSYNDQRAEHSGEYNCEQIVLCLTPANVFKVKLAVKRLVICIGFALNNAPLDDLQEFKKKSWWIRTIGMECYEKGVSKHNNPGHNIAEGAVVSIEKHSQEKALTFRLNNQVTMENLNTGLEKEDFQQLVGFVTFFRPGDAVQIQ